MDEVLFEEMFCSEERHWWFQAKHQIVESLLQRFLATSSAQPPRVADLGCGCGLMLHNLKTRYQCVGMDASEQAIKFCAQRGLSVERGGLPTPIPFADHSFDAVLLLDVLEHLDEDAATVRSVKRLLRPNGIIIATSPAYQWLWTTRDAHHHHRRRYQRRAFTDLFVRAGLCVRLSSYMNTVLFPIAAMERLYRRVKPLSEGVGDLAVPPRKINALMRSAFASERHLLGRVRLPFGLSVICVAQNRD